jgi:ATP-dependent DNA helicase 2 subunit 2
MGAADLDAAKKALLTLLQKKVDARPKDEVGLVLIGARDTKNALVAPLGSGADVTMDEDGADAGYAHVHSVHDLDLAAIAHMKTVDGLERSEAAGSYIDGLIVALDLLHKRKAQKKMNGRILVVTNAACAAEELEDLDAVVGGLVADGVEVEVWGIGFGGAEGRSPAQRDNEAMFASLAARTGGGSAVHAVAGAADMMALACAAPVRPTPLFRGALEVGCIDGDTASGFKVAVYCYARTKAVGLPSLKKIKKSVLHAPPKVKAEPGAEAVDSDDELTGGVVRDSTYRALHDIDIEVPPQQRLKGYTYGRKPITYTKEMEAAMKWSAAKRLVVLGFVPTRSIARTRYIGTSRVCAARACRAAPALRTPPRAAATVEAEVPAPSTHVRPRPLCAPLS